MTKQAHEKARDDLAEQQATVTDSWRNHPIDETHGEVYGRTSSGEEKEKALEIHAVDRKVFLNSHGEIVLDQEAVITLRKLLDQAFQTVS